MPIRGHGSMVCPKARPPPPAAQVLCSDLYRTPACLWAGCCPLVPQVLLYPGCPGKVHNGPSQELCWGRGVPQTVAPLLSISGATSLNQAGALSPRCQLK